MSMGAFFGLYGSLYRNQPANQPDVRHVLLAGVRVCERTVTSNDPNSPWCTPDSREFKKIERWGLSSFIEKQNIFVREQHSSMWRI